MALISSRVVPSLLVITKSRPGVPTVLESICVVILLSLSLSLSPDSHSVRPSVSQSAGPVWYGYTEFRKHTNLDNTIFIPTSFTL